MGSEETRAAIVEPTADELREDRDKWRRYAGELERTFAPVAATGVVTLLHMWKAARDAARTWRSGDVSGSMSAQKKVYALASDLIAEALRAEGASVAPDGVRRCLATIGGCLSCQLPLGHGGACNAADRPQ